MLKTLERSDIDKLRNHLIVPLAVSDILYHDLEVEPDMQYGLHMALSEIDSDSALLAIALCAVDLAERNMIYAPIASALQSEAQNIIEEYGPAWLYHHTRGPMPQDTYLDILQTVPEDLEALGDLMDALCADLGCVNDTTPLLCNLLSVQARAHMEITEFILSESTMNKDNDVGFTLDFIEEKFNFEQQTPSLNQEKSNIILFPCGSAA